MDELRAADSVRYFASQYANLVFVAEQLEKIGSLKGQIDSLSTRRDEINRDIELTEVDLHTKRQTAHDEEEAHGYKMQELIADYANRQALLEQDLAEKTAEQDAALHRRAEEAEREFQAARDAHQTHMRELHDQLDALGQRVQEATADAEEAEARRNRAQEVVNKLQSTIEAIKFQGVDA